MSEHSTHPGGYEKKDTNVKVVAWVAVTVIILVIIFAVILNELYVVTKEEVIREAVLEPVPASVLELRAYEDSVLNSYELIDTAAGIYRIPIDSAMKLAAQAASK